MSNIQTWAGYNLTTRTRIASGTTAQRPSAGTVGWRYNSTTGRFEADTGSAWKNVVASDLNLATDLVTGGGVVCLQRTRTEITATDAAYTKKEIENNLAPINKPYTSSSDYDEQIKSTMTPDKASKAVEKVNEIEKKEKSIKGRIKKNLSKVFKANK